MKRLVLFLILAALLAGEIYSQQPWWWVYVLGPMLATAWKAILALPLQAKCVLGLTAFLVAFAVWFVKQWGLHVLLATAVLVMIPGVSLWLALELSLGSAIVAIVLQTIHMFRHREARRHQRTEPVVTYNAGGSARPTCSTVK